MRVFIAEYKMVMGHQSAWYYLPFFWKTCTGGNQNIVSEEIKDNFPSLDQQSHCYYMLHEPNVATELLGYRDWAIWRDWMDIPVGKRFEQKQMILSNVNVVAYIDKSTKTYDLSFMLLIRCCRFCFVLLVGFWPLKTINYQCLKYCRQHMLTIWTAHWYKMYTYCQWYVFAADMYTKQLSPSHWLMSAVTHSVLQC